MISFLFCLLLFIRRSGQKTFFKNKKRQNLEVLPFFCNFAAHFRNLNCKKTIISVKSLSLQYKIRIIRI